MITRRDWWIGIGVIGLALLAHAVIPQYVPRYEWQHWTEGIYVKIDRWAGTAERGVWKDLPARAQ